MNKQKDTNDILRDIVENPEKYSDKKKIAAMKLIMLNAAFLINSLSKHS